MANIGLSETEITQQELERFRNNYYRDNFRRVAKWLIIMLLLNAILAITVAYLYYAKPKEPSEFYASNIDTSDVRVIEPLSAPTISPKTLINWVQKTVIATYSFNFTNYRNVFNDLQKNFTNTGWQTFNKVMRNSKLLDEVTNKQLFVDAVINGNTKIVSDGVIDGHYAWKIQVPILVTYKSSAPQAAVSHSKIPLIVTIIIRRIADFTKKNAVAIDSFEIARVKTAD